MCDNAFVREDSLKCHLKQHRDLSKASLSTAYAVLKLQQPVVNVSMPQDSYQNVAETFNPETPYIPAVARADSQLQSQSDLTSNSLRMGQGQADTGQGQTPNLGIKDILAAAGINNGAKDISPGKSSSNSLNPSDGIQVVKSLSAAATTVETMTTNFVPNFTISPSPQDVPSLQVMQNISLPYIRLPNGQVLVLSGQSPVGQTATLAETPETYLATRESVTNLSQDTESEQTYQVTLEPVRNLAVAQRVTIPVSASQPGAIPIQIIVPSDSQHSLPIVSQLLNSSLSTSQNLAQKPTNQEDTKETQQNFVVHIPGNPGNLINTSGPIAEGQSQSFVLQIPGSGPSYGINTDLQQNYASPVPGHMLQMTADQSSESQDVS